MKIYCPGMVWYIIMEKYSILQILSGYMILCFLLSPGNTMKLLFSASTSSLKEKSPGMQIQTFNTNTPIQRRKQYRGPIT